MQKPKNKDEIDESDLKPEPGTPPPAEPIETDSNDDPEADASGDSDDEREDENQAVP